MVGQPYKIYIQLEMPESRVNKDLGTLLEFLFDLLKPRLVKLSTPLNDTIHLMTGMFMVCASLRVRSGIEVTKACRSAMLHYRSPLLETLTTLSLSPLLVLGQTEEKQSVTVELFSDFEEDQVRRFVTFIDYCLQ